MNSLSNFSFNFIDKPPENLINKQTGETEQATPLTRKRADAIGAGPVKEKGKLGSRVSPNIDNPALNNPATVKTVQLPIHDIITHGLLPPDVTSSKHVVKSQEEITNQKPKITELNAGLTRTKDIADRLNSGDKKIRAVGVGKGVTGSMFVEEEIKKRKMG